MSECPYKLFLLTPSSEIDRCEVLEGSKALRVKLRHDGIETENVKWFRLKVAVWDDKVCTKYLSRSLVWKTLRLIIFKSVQYPLSTIYFSAKHCTHIMAPALKVALPKIGYQSNMTRDLLYGPLLAQGGNFPLSESVNLLNTLINWYAILIILINRSVDENLC